MTQTTRRPFLPLRWFIRAAWAVHRAVYRLSGGRRGLRPPTPATYGILGIHTIGRRSGVERMAMLGYFEDGPNLFTLAMNGWGDPEPAWWLNLQAQPDTEAMVGHEWRRVHAREASDAEREELWPRFVDMYRGYDHYKEIASREMPVVVLEVGR